MKTPPLSETEHLNQARHNEQVLALIVRDVVSGYAPAFDWALVIMFYAAMHYASSWLYRDTGGCPSQHASRYDAASGLRIEGLNDAVSRTYGITVAPSYYVLFDRAWEARYRALYLTQTSRRDVVDLLDAHRRHLEVVKDAKV